MLARAVTCKLCIPGFFDVLMLERHTVSLHFGGVPFSNSSRSLQRPEFGKIKMLKCCRIVVVILTS